MSPYVEQGTLRKLPRTWRREARRVECPICKAAAGDYCYAAGRGHAKRLRRKSCHLERHTAAIAKGAPVAYE